MLASTAAVVAGLVLTAGCTTAANPAGGPTGDGQFVVTYADVPSSLAGLSAQRAGVVDVTARLLDDRVGLPDDVAIEARSCTSGTGYDPEGATIEICLQDVKETRDLLRDADADDRGATERGISQRDCHARGRSRADRSAGPGLHRPRGGRG